MLRSSCHRRRSSASVYEWRAPPIPCNRQYTAAVGSGGVTNGSTTCTRSRSRQNDTAKARCFTHAEPRGSHSSRARGRSMRSKKRRMREDVLRIGAEARRTLEQHGGCPEHLCALQRSPPAFLDFRRFAEEARFRARWQSILHPSICRTGRRVRNQLPYLHRVFQGWGRHLDPPAHHLVARRLVKGVLNLDHGKVKSVVRHRHREPAETDAYVCETVRCAAGHGRGRLPTLLTPIPISCRLEVRNRRIA